MLWMAIKDAATTAKMAVADSSLPVDCGHEPRRRVSGVVVTDDREVFVRATPVSMALMG